MKIEGVEITHPDRVLFREAGISKLDIVKYYDKVSEDMLPFLRDRPLTLQRFPDSIEGNGFYQKHAQSYFPAFIKRIDVETKEGKAREIICNNKKTLLYLANQGTVSFHIWLSKKEDLHRPDKVVFDLDPSVADFKKVKMAARIIRAFLEGLGKVPQVMTTGKSGLHVFYKIRRTRNFDAVREEIRGIAEELAATHSDLLTTEVRKNKRGDRIFLDYLRNAYAQTSVCPYSLRPTKKGGIATLIDWEELDGIQSGDHFHLRHRKRARK